MNTDVSALNVTAGVFGTVSAAALIMLLTEAIKDFFPQLHGRAAAAVVYAEALVVSLVVLSQTDVRWSWRDSDLWVAAFVGTLSLGIVAQGIYARLYHVAVEGLPPSPDAEVPLAAVDMPPPQPPPQGAAQP